MSTITVTNIIGGQNAAKYPALQGSEIALNMYLEKNGQNAYLKSCPGIRFLAEIDESNNPCQGSYVASVGLSSNDSKSDAFFVISDKVYRYNTTISSINLIGTLNTGAKPIFSETGGERPLLLIADGVDLWYYDLKNGGMISKIALPNRITGDEPIAPTHVACVAGSIIVNDSGTGYCYYSIPYPLAQETRDVYDIVDGEVQYEGLTVKTKSVQADQWVFLDDFGTPQYKNGESNSDSVEAIYAIGSSLTVFGPKSIEFWQRGSNEYETWTRTSYTYNKEIGLDATYSISSVNNNICFLSNGMNAGRAVFAISGTQFTKISDTWLDEILDRSDTSSAIGFSYSRSNHAFYCLYLPNCKNERGQRTPRTFCYDFSTQTWGERSSRDVSRNIDTAWNLIHAIWYDNKTIFGSIKGGNIFYLDDNFHAEEVDVWRNKIPQIRMRQSSVIINNYQSFMLDEMGVEMNTGTIDDYTRDPYILLDVSEDGGMSFGNTQMEQVGKTGQTNYRVKFSNLGMQRLCVLRLSFSENMDLVLTNVSMRLTPLTYSI